MNERLETNVSSNLAVRSLQQAPTNLHRHRIHETWLAAKLFATTRTVVDRKHGIAFGHVHTGGRIFRFR